MKCPADDAPLVRIERLGVALNVCATCHGVWLARDALDAVIARADRERREPETDAIGQHREASGEQSGRADNRRIDLAAEARMHDPFGDRRPAREPSFLSQLFDV